ncbi:hypothetical protein BU15DRAFT_68307 [Melanogaster broomeanus]|nr:hypothetical protein BU15DRAFT_68307 [Melanogaster broomeanus]
MSALSELVVLLKNMQLIDYISVAATAAVCYDYILTFSREVGRLLKPWSTMTILFIMLYRIILYVTQLFLKPSMNNWYAAGRGVLSVSQVGQGIHFCKTMVIDCFLGQLLAGSLKLQMYAALHNPLPSNILKVFLSGTGIIEFSAWAGSCTAWQRKWSQHVLSQGEALMLTIYGAIPGILFDLFLLSLALYGFAVHLKDTREKLGKARVNVYMRLLFEHIVYAYKDSQKDCRLPSTPLQGLSLAIRWIALSVVVPMVLDTRIHTRTRHHLVLQAAGIDVFLLMVFISSLFLARLTMYCLVMTSHCMSHVSRVGVLVMSSIEAGANGALSLQLPVDDSEVSNHFKRREYRQEKDKGKCPGNEEQTNGIPEKRTDHLIRKRLGFLMKPPYEPWCDHSTHSINNPRDIQKSVCIVKVRLNKADSKTSRPMTERGGVVFCLHKRSASDEAEEDAREQLITGGCEDEG